MESFEKLKIKLLGTGTSHGVPMIGCDCAVCQSDQPEDKRMRCSAALSNGTSTIVIDCGPDFRQQMLSAKAKSIQGIVFTHAHRDHIAGIDDIRAFNFLSKSPIKMYCTAEVREEITGAFSYIFQNPNYPGVPKVDFQTISTQPFTVRDLKIIPIPLMHNKLPVLGFRIDQFAYVTDVSFIPDSSIELLKNLEVLVLGCLRIEPHFSHFNLEEAVEIAEKVKAKKTLLIHMSHDIGFHDKVNKSLPKHIQLAFDGQEIQIG